MKPIHNLSSFTIFAFINHILLKSNKRNKFFAPTAFQKVTKVTAFSDF